MKTKSAKTLNLKESIKAGTFIQDLEVILEEKPQAERTTFEEFKGQLWQFLCCLPTRSKTKLEKQMQIRNKYNYNGNIGNIQLEIIDKLGISFMLNDYQKYSN